MSYESGFMSENIHPSRNEKNVHHIYHESVTSHNIMKVWWYMQETLRHVNETDVGLCI